MADCPRGSLTTRNASPGATHLYRCHPPLPVPPTSAGATHLYRCHPPLPVPPTFVGATHLCRCHPLLPVPPTLAGATHLGVPTWCLAPNSANEPIVRFLRVGRIARHRVQANRPPVPPTLAVLRISVLYLRRLPGCRCTYRQPCVVLSMLYCRPGRNQSVRRNNSCSPV